MEERKNPNQGSERNQGGSQHRDQDRDNARQGQRDQNPDRDHRQDMNRDPSEGKVGQDTDGDGKVVKPGQKPGQSGGRGLPENK